VALTETPQPKSAPVRGVVTVLARGRTTTEVVDELMAELADEPRVVEVDLTEMAAEGTAMGEEFGPVGHYLQHWPGTVVLVNVPDPVVRSTLASADHAHRMLIRTTWDADTLEAHRLLPHLRKRRLSLPPLPTAPGMARDFVAHTTQDWRLPSLMTPASQVLSELVTHAVIDAEEDLEVSLSCVDTRIRMAVTNSTAATTTGVFDLPQYPLGGRVRQLVAALAQAWGVIPGRPAGRTVWAVLDASRVTTAGETGPARRERPDPRHRGPAEADVLIELHSGSLGRHRRDDEAADDRSQIAPAP
jgi:hypothetical protein